MAEITINVNSKKINVDNGVPIFNVINNFPDKNRIIAVKLDQKVVDLSTKLEKDSNLEPIYMDSEEGLDILRHSCAHVMAAAVKDIFKKVNFGIGPTIESGFYYDFDLDTKFSEGDLVKIEKKMKEIVKADHKFIRKEISKKEAKKIFKDNPYKIELIEELQAETVSTYESGGFVDLCRGPHIPSTRYIKAYKLLSIAGAYWRGSEKNKMLQRIYGTAFVNKEALEEHLKLLEEAKKRDHRILGRDLDLFSINDEIGAGLVLWHPKGALLKHLIEDFWRSEHLKNGYDLVSTPHIGKEDFWNTSGHLDFYKENMYSPMDIDGLDYYIKPMNCPFHMKIYKTKVRSYRDLPFRWAELGTVYRYERSGVLHGLMRVRGFTQDDAHLIFTKEQLDSEIERVTKFTIHMLNSFGFYDFNVYLSTRPEKRIGDDKKWDLAEAALKKGLEAVGLKYEIDPGEGVFYGPKIDIKIKDALNREWQCSTIQADFNLPERFNMTYSAADGKLHQPIMIHRALLGSIERFIGCLIEHYKGDFPLWLAPLQVKILPVTDRVNDYAKEIMGKLEENGIRVESDLRAEKLGYKIREAELTKIPYMIIVGDKEKDSKTLSIRARHKGEEKGILIEEFLGRLKGNIDDKKIKGPSTNDKINSNN